MIVFLILITCLVDIVLILYGEILSWSLMGVKGLNVYKIEAYFMKAIHHSFSQLTGVMTHAGC